MELDVHELLDCLQSYDECLHIEAKESFSHFGKSARETISAFSNEPDLGGGYLVLGLRRNEDRNSAARYTLLGVQDPDKLQCELSSACREEFNVPISPELCVELIDGKALVIAFIPESPARDKPVFLKKLGLERGAFRRIGASDYRCTASDLDFLYQLRSGISYESEVLSDVSWEDIDSDAITSYRRQRAQVDPAAAELGFGDKELLISLRCLIPSKSSIIPNVAGLLLFGKKASLRRVLPMDARVDYVITEGPEWIGNPSSRHYSTEYRESLITLLPRLHAQVMGDLPKLFTLETGKLQRIDKEIIPRDVIREALSNALMHRDYRAKQPTLIIRYSNRLEFKNAGYSLKPFEELGQPGSKQRNPIIAAVFHDLKYAETKGTGIGSMKAWMREAGLTTPPIIETDRDRNEFDLVLLPHHLLDQKDFEWLAQFSKTKLSDAEKRALVLVREMGAITNQDYRQINGADTLTASRALVRLRDLGLLTMKGSGNNTYYVIQEQMIVNHPENQAAPYINPLYNPLHKGLRAIPKGLSVPPSLKKAISRLSHRDPREKIEEIIKKLCSIYPLKPSQLGRILNRDAQYLRIHFLSKMLKKGELIYEYPEQPAHPQQAYKTPPK